MHGFVSLDFDLGTARDEKGNDVKLSFCLVKWNEQVRKDFVLIDDELHKCSKFSFVLACVRFWVEPAEKNRVVAIKDMSRPVEDGGNE